MKKNKIQNIVIVVIATVIIGSIIAYNYAAEQTRQRGLQFGNELSQIQQDVADLQTKFYSEKIKWDEGDISKEELLEFYEEHLKEFKEVNARYDQLTPPELFKSSVELFKISAETQLQSDIEYVKWIKTGEGSAKIRSDTQIQEAYEYENLGLAEFQAAKRGVKNYDTPEQFSAPKVDLNRKVIEISENMKRNCDAEFYNESGQFDSEEIRAEWFNCYDDAEEWKAEHLS